MTQSSSGLPSSTYPTTPSRDSIPSTFAIAGRRRSASIMMVFSPCMAHMRARFVTTKDLPSEGVVDVKRSTLASFAMLLTFSIECTERNASVVALSAFDTAT